MSTACQPIKIRLKLKDFSDVLNLPDISNITSSSCNTTVGYNGIDAVSFFQTISDFYEQSKFWSNNLFSLPAGQNSKKFISLMSYWVDQFNHDTPYMGIALKVVMILPNLLLQKPSKSSKTVEHQKLLNERLQKWESGSFHELFRECLCIQRKLISSARTEESTSQLFVRFMLHGKVNAAIRLLERDGSCGVLPLSDDTLGKLKDKHPDAALAYKGSLLFGPIDDIPASYYDRIDERMIENAIKQTKGAAGPSNMCGQFCQVFCHKKFSNEGRTFRESIARLAKKLATEVIDPQHLDSFVACKLIPLDKCPGIRPIGIGETLRRVVGKAISWVVKADAMVAAGPLQVAAGIKSGAEGAIHAIRDIYENDEDSEAIILIDAQNAFNSMNRAAALHNIRIICPEVATYIINTYRSPPRLIIKADRNTGDEIRSLEGTTQGDNLGMIFYCLGIIPVLRSLKTLIESSELSVKQAWLADDASAVG